MYSGRGPGSPWLVAASLISEPPRIDGVTILNAEADVQVAGQRMTLIDGLDSEVPHSIHSPSTVGRPSASW